MNVNAVIKVAIPVAIAIFAAKTAAHLTGNKAGAVGFLIEVAGGVTGALLASKLNVAKVAS
jgi:hypothetical protein